MQARIFRDLGFDLSGDILFDLLRADPRPWAHDHGTANRDIRILAFRHCPEGIDAPQHDSQQEDPRDGAILDKEASGIVRIKKLLVLSVMRHQGMTRTSAPSLSMVAPRRTTRSPFLTPEKTVISFPIIWPSCTWRSRATVLLPFSWTTKTP